MADPPGPSGNALELAITLGTGLGTAFFLDGVPTPHLELALMPFHGSGTFQDHLGNATRRHIGNRRWSKRVLEAVEMFDALLHFDRLYVGGGNAKKLRIVITLSHSSSALTAMPPTRSPLASPTSRPTRRDGPGCIAPRGAGPRRRARDR